jgi:hypothetical protein
VQKETIADRSNNIDMRNKKTTTLKEKSSGGYLTSRKRSLVDMDEKSDHYLAKILEGYRVHGSSTIKD